MYLTQEDHQALLNASVSGIAAVEQALSLIRNANPKALHMEQSLASRVFFDQPMRNEPYGGFMYFAQMRKAA
ncbi:hypothetical protein P3T24_006541 [Paraburkholderia sp. GAS33]|uniref:hypothetical protein n=1 Tax=Paraburkholderia sp. GAS33 TaxID=3035130 RepID=UPI003D2164BE